jgi:hypothetical protein
MPSATSTDENERDYYVYDILSVVHIQLRKETWEGPFRLSALNRGEAHIRNSSALV